ncbi:MAG: BatA domain-containing protein [Planctomycetota bacterium]
MEFLHPLMLYGAIMAGVPLIIHLIFRRQYQTIVWAAMDFLLQAIQQTKRRLLLENLILLLLRMLILVVLALALARPIFKNTPLSFLTGDVKENLILVLDNSYSMRYSEQTRTPFENAKDKALELLKGLKSERDTISLITTQGKKTSASASSDSKEESLNSVVMEFSSNLDEARREIEDLTCSQSSGSIFEAIPTLKRLISNGDYPNKKIYILTDMQKNCWDPTTGEKSEESSLELEFRRLSEKSTITIIDTANFEKAENVAVVDLFCTEKLIGTNSSVQFMVRVQNFGEKIYSDNEKISLDFFVDGEKQGGDAVELKPYQTKEVYFSHEFSTAGPHFVNVESQNDKLTLDNHRFFAFQVTQSVPILVVDGEPKAGPYESETDTLFAALSPLPEGANYIFRPKRIKYPEFDQEDINQYKIILFANVEMISSELIEPLERFLQEGNNLLFFLGKKVNADEYNQYFYKDGLGFFPAKLQRIQGDPTRKEWVSIIPKNYDHPLLALFDKMPELLESTPIYQYFISHWDERASPDTKLIASYNDTNKTPAILEKKFGRGKVLLYTTSCDIDWNDLAFSICYLPLLTETIEYLAYTEERFQNVEVFQPFEKYFSQMIKEEIYLGIPDEEGSASLARTRLDLKQLGTENRMYFQFLNTERIGLYQLFREKNESPEEVFSVNLDTRESNLDRVTEEQLKEKLGNNPKIAYLRTGVTENAFIAITKDAEYWRMLLYLLLGLVLLETYLAQKFGNYSR